MSLTTDLTEQEDIKYQTVTGVNWEISPSDKVDPVPDDTIGIDFANGYTKGKSDMMKKIEVAIKEIEELETHSFIYNRLGQVVDTIISRTKAIDIIRKHTGG